MPNGSSEKSLRQRQDLIAFATRVVPMECCIVGSRGSIRCEDLGAFMLAGRKRQFAGANPFY